MHPFGGTAICPRCDKAVYAAEQVMGPGRKLYHKPCLACTLCNKRLDSYTLLEHDQQPYCKPCHVKNFGIRDLRHANLPHRESTCASPPSTPSSPIKGSQFVFPGPSRLPLSLAPPQERTVYATNNEDDYSCSNHAPPLDPQMAKADDEEEDRDQFIREPQFPPSPHHSSFTRTLGRSNSSATTNLKKTFSPLVATATGSVMRVGAGTRYGVALTGQPTGGPSTRIWGGGTPSCGRCGRSVYFAEQLKAIGKTYHKGCLRCTECNTNLDSNRLTEKDGEPLCHRCYGKLYGPHGSGYALLGKAGG